MSRKSCIVYLNIELHRYFVSVGSKGMRFGHDSLVVIASLLESDKSKFLNKEAIVPAIAFPESKSISCPGSSSLENPAIDSKESIADESALV